MAHYAFINDDNIVVEVITGIDEDETDNLPDGFDSWEAWYADFRGLTCKRTSYNTVSNTHKLGGTPFRGNYAGLGSTYDETNDVFYGPRPYASWSLNDDWDWVAPLAYPDDGEAYHWDEDAYQADNSTGWVTD